MTNPHTQNTILLDRLKAACQYVSRNRFDVRFTIVEEGVVIDARIDGSGQSISEVSWEEVVLANVNPLIMGVDSIMRYGNKIKSTDAA